jgi:23S rRNA (guanine1835-N2)-methyltransferase
MTESTFESAFGIFQLERLPRRKKELLRAWDAADEYLLQTLFEEGTDLKRPLICNDSFGALGVGLAAFAPISWSDSWLTHQALQENLSSNSLDKSAVDCLPSTSPLSGKFDLVLMKVPKNLALLEYQLIQLKPHLVDNARLMLAGMVKMMPSSIWKLLEKTIGPTETSRAQKKARIITARPDSQLPQIDSKYPLSWKLEGSSFTLLNHANTFSREKLDNGTRLMLKHLPETEGEGDIVDLGCGNGVLGLVAAHNNPLANIHFIDESYMAIESTRLNAQQLGEREGSVNFYTADGLKEFVDNSQDLVLCNPPFHQQQAQLDTMALSMFTESARVLREGGALWVIGNRHLHYHNKLKSWFKQVEVIASDRKFVLLKANN